MIPTPKAGEAAIVAPSAPAVLRPDTEDQPTEVLFREAKRRERHRRLIVLAVIVVLLGGAGLVYALSNGKASPPTSNAPAPNSYLHAFLARAQRGLDSSFHATYTTVEALSDGGSRVETVRVAQRSSTQFMYADWSAGTALSAFYLDALGSSQTAGHDLSTCSTSSTNSSQWTCAPVGEGTVGSDLIGGYLLADAVSGLTFLVALRDKPTLAPPSLGTVRAVLAVKTTKTIGHLKLSCVAFGPPRNPWATICLTSTGLVGYYASHPDFATEALGTTKLVTYGSGASRVELTLPGSTARR